MENQKYDIIDAMCKAMQMIGMDGVTQKAQDQKLHIHPLFCKAKKQADQLSWMFAQTDHMRHQTYTIYNQKIKLM